MRNKNFDAMKPSLVMMLTVLINFIPYFVIAQITRTQIMNNAIPYTTFTWTATNSNIWYAVGCGGKTVQTPSWVKIGSNTGMPYCWGGWTATTNIQGLLNSGKSAGDINTNTSFGAGESCAAGLDCSGFVSRAWALNSKQSTNTLPNISTQINLSQVQQGDMLNYAGSHTRLVSSVNGNGSINVLESSAKDWKVSLGTYTPAQLTNYISYYYNNVSNGGTAPGPFTLTLTPKCDGTTSEIVLNWTPSINATSYDVYRNGSLYSPAGVGLTGFQFINSGNITVGSNYSYYVQAKNSYGSINSNTQSATAPNCSDSPPIVSSFSINQSSIILGNSFTLFYSVSDDVGLSRVELWRTTDLNNSPNGNGWIQIKTTNLSGQKSYSSSFTDSPTSQGIYWYGIHAVDTKNQQTNEPNPPGPLKGIVSSSTLTVVYPNGNETLLKGTNYNITWNSSYVSGNIQIDLYKGITNVLQLASGASNTGSYPFNPPSNLTDGSDYRIGISAMNGTVSDFSNNYFTISSPPKQYSVILSSNPSNGGTTSGGGTYNSGSSVTVTATPNSGYTFSNWTENGSQVSTSSSYTFTISSSRTLVANFAAIPPTQYTVSLSSNPSNGGTTSGGGTYNSGSSVTVTATPNSGYTFSNWTENGAQVSTSTSYAFIISGNRNLVANFTRIQYTVSLSSNPSYGGTTSGGGTYNSGSSVTVTATPNSGYTFSNWTENGAQISTNSSYTFTISSSRTLVANFAAIPPTQYTVSLSSNPSNGGTTSGGGTYNSGSSVTVTATSNSGYTFTNWTENGTQVSTSSSYTFTISSSRTLVANFTAIPPTQYSVSLSSNPTNGGTTSGGGTYNSGSSVTVSAIANSGYLFSSWTESATQVSTSSSYTFTISSNRTLVANFSIAATPTITVSTHSLPDFGSVIVGQNSSAQPYTVTGSNLTSNITLQAPAGFQIGLSSSSVFTNTLTLTQSGGIVQTTPIYARFSPLITGIQSGNISHTSNGATPENVSVSGTGINVPSCNYTLSSSGVSIYSPAQTNSFWVYTASGCSWTATTSGCSGMITLTNATGTGNGMVTFDVSANASASSRSCAITVGGQTFTVTQAGYAAPCSSAPIAPNNLTVDVIDSNVLYLSWDGNNTNVTDFEIERGLSATGPFAVIGSSGNSFGYRDANVIGGTTYYYRVKACCSSNCSNYTNVASKQACTFSASATGITATADTIFQGDNVTLTVQGGTLGTGATWTWRTTQCNSGPIVGTGTSITVTPNSSTNYVVKPEGGNCVTSVTCVNKSVTVKPLPPTQYSISLSSNPPNGGTTSGSGIYSSGSSVTVTATPSSGYTFTNWTESGTQVSTSSSYTFTISSSRTLVANFVAIPPTQYSVSPSSNPANGGTTSGGGTYNSGSSVTVSATANSGYVFSNWTESGTQVSTSSSYTFTISSSRTLVANFTVIPPTQYSISLSSNPPNGGTTSGSGIYNSGSSVTVTATSNSGYTFTNWTESGTQVSTSSSYTFTMPNNDRNLVANFTTTPRTVSTSSHPNNGGTTSGGGTYTVGSSVTVTAIANSGYTFTNWIESETVVSASSSYTFTMPNNDRNLVANFILSTSASIKPILASATIPKGTEFWVEVKVGDPNTVNDLYGISFRLNSNNSNCTYVDQSAIQGDFLGSSVIPFSQKFDNQSVDIAITKTSAPGVSGSGTVAKAKFTSSSNITADQAVVFSISNIVANNSSGNTIPMTPATATVTIIATTTVNVWPGDCNNDLIVSAADILPIGQYYGQTLSNANNPGSQWQAYPRQPWSADGASPKRVYADANGDGAINSTDVLPIGLNYGKTHSTSNGESFLLSKINNIESFEKSLANATLKLIGPSKIRNNTNFTIQVVVGDPISITDLYGISFKIKSNSSTCTFVENSAQQGQFFSGNILKFFQTVDNQTVDAALTKTSTPGVSGSGTVATFDYTSTIDQTVTFSLLNVSATDSQGNTILLDVLPTNILVDVLVVNEIPKEYSLTQNYPNPFNPSTKIRFDIPEQTQVKLSIYDILGREVEILVDKDMNPGSYEITFDASKFTSGVYFYRLQTGSFMETKKLILVK